MLLLGFLASVITYLDRVCISVAAPSITKELGLSAMQMGYVFSVFALAYAIFEIPAGWWGDRIGQRKVMTRIVACWSGFTILTGMVWSYPSLLATRFAFGAGEAGAFPTLSRALARWFPPNERARASGVMWMGARLGGSMAPAVAALLIAHIGWRGTFIVFGATGLLWCAVFWRWYRDNPAEHAGVNEAELQHIGAGSAAEGHGGQAPWRGIVSSGTMWALFGMYFCSAYGFWFSVTWLPTFLMKEYGLTLERSGLYSSLPLAGGAIGCVAGGAFADWLVRRTGSLKWSRRAIGATGFLLAAAGSAFAAFAREPFLAVLCLAIAQCAHDMTLPVSWATVTDVGGRFGGTTSAFMNMASSLSAMVSSVSAAWLMQTFGSFHATLVVASAVYVVGGFLWLRIDPEEALDS